ncbi:putative enoyl-CoA hydratase echA8 [Rosistilla oblonga]|uniref:Putative enoyl-CoA hydratase echA8 n=1 Tax=Rosistilla oblonga TaxID=2527990 RepID=A0A518IQQ9_9BACT|nr:enoyl-CoA hydratase/isomerase family protein [Rosistilla oblonga]QDV11408.1 putative enoyl-CoA hydratase echA8 [Rosistilla oblonga]QDV55432.1 putative enoyl-CoA hydratase echA8 [Rosistilla oblonga]
MTAVNVLVNSPSGTIQLTRPDQRNALDRSAVEQISQAFFDLHQEKKVRGVILTASGTDFCAGLDLKEMHQTASGDPNSALGAWHDDWTQLRDLLETMLRFPKPIIAAIDGTALGAGLGLALAADLIVAAPSATFGVPAVRRGLISGVVSPLLCFRSGGKTAARMMLTGQSIDAQEALRLNLIDEIVDADKIWVRANELVAECAAAPAEAIQLSKRLLNETIGETLLTQMSVGAAMGATACTTEAAAEGLAAFKEKREPNWP